jgi:hypothetical protein
MVFGANQLSWIHGHANKVLFLLAAGIMNELASLVGNYFADNLTELKKLGLPYTHLRYSSQRAIPRNAGKLFQDVLDIAEKVCT